MPNFSGKRSHDSMNSKKWGGGGGGARNLNQRRDDRRSGSMQNRNMGGARPMVSPWENGVTPGMQSNFMSDFSQPSNYMVNPGMNRGNFVTPNFGGFGNNDNKIRRLERMGGFDDQRGRGLLPSPSNTPLLGVAPPSFPPPSRGPEFLQQRMGTPWGDSSFHSGGPRGMSSGYYPTNRGRQDNSSRKFIKAKRPMNKPNPSNKGNTSLKEGKGKAKGAASKSPSVKEREDKDKASPHSKELKSKHGDVSPSKSERSSEGKNKEGESTEDVEMEEGKEEATGEQGKEDAEAVPEKEEEPFPVQALYCHICELDSFNSKKGYIRHLQGITHAKMAELFHAKNAATLELLNISAKLAEMRQRDKVLRRTGKKGQPVMKTTEQILVQKWLKVGSCCGTNYKSPFGMEEHKLSIHHLKAKYALKQKAIEDKPKEGEEADKEKEKDEKVEAEGETHDEILRVSQMLEKARAEAEGSPLTMQTMPAFNPSTLVGLEYIKREMRFRCRICKRQMFKSIEHHCQSHAHYESIVSQLNKTEDAKREVERKEQERKEEEEKKAKEEEEKIKKEVEEEEEEEEEGEGGDGIPADYITVDCSDDTKDNGEEEKEDMAEDLIPLNEDEEKIMNTEDGDEEEEEQEDLALQSEIFEEIGEKLDLGEEEKTSIANGEEEEKEEKEEKEEEEEEEMKPPPKKMAYTPRRRGRGRGRGKWSK